MMETPGEVAYDAYRTWLVARGHDLLAEFRDLPADERDAWEHAAKVLCRYGAIY